jgi:hypothetical protein
VLRRLVENARRPKNDNEPTVVMRANLGLPDRDIWRELPWDRTDLSNNRGSTGNDHFRLAVPGANCQKKGTWIVIFYRLPRITVCKEGLIEQRAGPNIRSK